MASKLFTFTFTYLFARVGDESVHPTGQVPLCRKSMARMCLSTELQCGQKACLYVSNDLPVHRAAEADPGHSLSQVQLCCTMHVCLPGGERFETRLHDSVVEFPNGSHHDGYTRDLCTGVANRGGLTTSLRLHRVPVSPAIKQPQSSHSGTTAFHMLLASRWMVTRGHCAQESGIVS